MYFFGHSFELLLVELELVVVFVLSVVKGVFNVVDLLLKDLEFLHLFLEVVFLLVNN